VAISAFIIFKTIIFKSSVDIPHSFPFSLQDLQQSLLLPIQLEAAYLTLYKRCVNVKNPG